MSFFFPNNPTLNQQSTQNGRVYRWTGNAWEILAGSISINNFADNRVLTNDGTNTGIVAESGLVFDGQRLTIRPRATSSSGLFPLTIYNDIAYAGLLNQGPNLQLISYASGTNIDTNSAGRLVFCKYRGTESLILPSLSNDTICAIRGDTSDVSGVNTTSIRIKADVVTPASGSQPYDSSRIYIQTSSGQDTLNNLLSLEEDGEVYTNGYLTVDNGISAPVPILSLGTVSGNVAINYGVDRQIQTLTLNGTSVNFTKGTNWTTANRSVSVLMQISATTTTTVAFDSGFVTDWYSSLPTFTSGTYLINLRSIGSSVVQGYYIGKKL